MNTVTAKGISAVQVDHGRLAGLRLLLLLSSIPLSGCGGRFIYGVDMLNYGTEGIIILEMTGQVPFVRKPFKTQTGAGEDIWIKNQPSPGLVDLPFVIAMTPTIPSKYRDPTSGIGRFGGRNGKGGKLPDEVEIVWQVAELKDCRRVLWADRPPTFEPEDVTEEQKQEKWQWREIRLDELRTLGYDPSKHVRKSNCTYVRLPDRIHRRKLDMDAIRNSEAYQKTGKKDPYGSGYYTLNIELVFIEDQLRVTTSNGATNPWR